MTLLNSSAQISLLHRLLQAKLLRVFYYTRYSLLVSGQARLEHYCFFTDQATAALEDAREITRALILLDVTEGLSMDYPKLDLDGISFVDMLQQAIADEEEILHLCRILEQCLDQSSSFFLRLSRSLKATTRKNMATMGVMRLDAAPKATKIMAHSVLQSAA